jgi:hypothetical protein
MVPKSIQIHYYNGTNGSTLNALNGTLGAHENAHKEFARNWWTTENVQSAAIDRHISFIVSDAETQGETIGQFMLDLENAENQQEIDKLDVQSPIFTGVTW